MGKYQFHLKREGVRSWLYSHGHSEPLEHTSVTYERGYIRASRTILEPNLEISGAHVGYKEVFATLLKSCKKFQRVTLWHGTSEEKVFQATIVDADPGLGGI